MQVLYTFIVSVFLGGLLFYLTNVSLTPYNEEGLVDVRNLAIVTFVALLFIASFFSVFHQIIDKLFFRKFYQKPRALLAVRRGLLIGVLLLGLAWLRIFGFWEWHIIVLAFMLVILFEAFFVSIKSVNKKQKTDKQRDR
jgi:hypothetical protein